MSVLVLWGCDGSPTEPDLSPTRPPNVEAYVTGEALSNLDANGHFRLFPATVEGPYPIISSDEARAIAVGVIRTWYTNPNVTTIPGTLSLVEVAELQHGGPIEWESIRVGQRTPYFAESHLHPLPGELGDPAIRHFGPHFLVPFYVGATPVLSVGVSGYATNIYLDDSGFVRRAGTHGGGEFQATGIPLVLGGIAVPPSPEVAVKHAATEAGSRIIEVPALGVPGNRVSSMYARWRLRLEDAVEFQRVVDGATVVTSDVYVGSFASIADARIGGSSISSVPRLRMFVAAEEQPAEESIGSAHVPIREGYAVDLHEVTVRN